MIPKHDFDYTLRVLNLHWFVACFFGKIEQKYYERGKSMASIYSGTSMCGRIENTNRVKPIKCHCPSCYHAKKVSSMYVRYRCTYYCKDEPNKKYCTRYSKVEGKNLIKTRNKSKNKKK